MSRRPAGFTIVELLITITVIVILVGLSIIVTGNIQASARDSERQQDIATIGRGLEARYRNGSTYTDVSNSNAQVISSAGYYPGDKEMSQLLNSNTVTSLTDVLPGVNEQALTSPGKQRLTAICLAYNSSANSSACDSAEKDSVVQSAFSNGNSGWTDRYVYEFVGRDGKYCDSACVRYNLYWISETDKTVSKGIPGLKTYRGVRQ